MSVGTEMSFAHAAEQATSGEGPTAEHERLAVFVGHFEGIGRNHHDDGEFATERIGAWLAGGMFVTLEGYMETGEVPLLSLEVLGYDADAGEYTLHGFDNMGMQRRYSGQWRGDTLKLAGDTERVEFDLSEAPRTIGVHWQMRDTKRAPWRELCRYIEHPA